MGPTMINEVTYVGDIFLEPLHPPCTQNKPELKRSEPSAKTKMPVAVIDDGTYNV